MANENKADIKAPEVLESINNVLKEQDDINKLVESLASKDLGKDQMKEMTRMIKEREKTNRRKLSTLRKIYDDVSGRHVRKSLMKSAKQAIKQGQQVDLNDLLKKINETY